MGDVYLARDTKLERKVAIKVLPPSVTKEADRVARFQQEARTLATLNHPNIATLYGVEDAVGVKAIVMEFVEGPTWLNSSPIEAFPGAKWFVSLCKSRRPSMPLTNMASFIAI